MIAMSKLATARRTHGFTESVIREMTRLCHAHDGVNLSQGFPNCPAPDAVKRAACEAVGDDINQYAVTWGTPDLRQAIARASEDEPGARTLSPACRRLRNPPTGRLLTLDKERKLLLRERHRLRANAMASRTIDRIFENSRTSGASAIKCWWPPRNPFAC